MVKGIKETEIGLIPLDWEVKKIEPDVGIVKSGKRLPKGYSLSEVPNHHPYIRVADMMMGRIDESDIKYVPEEIADVIEQYKIYENEVYISVAGTLGIVGKIPSKLNGANLTENANKITDIKCNQDYLMYWLMGDYIRHQIDSTQTTGAQPKLALERIRNFLVPLPSTKEQNAIAEALSDMDKLIDVLEKKIEKKKNIKYGVLQKLIVGEERLDGYTGKWISINMAKKSKLKARIGWQGLTTAEYLDSGYSYLVTGTDFEDGHINWDECHYVTADRYFQDPNIQLTNGDVLITKDGTIGKVALVDGLNKPATLNSGVFVVRPINNAYSARFLYYVLESRVFRDFLDMLSAGSTIVHLYQKDLVNFSFMAPATLDEQEAIASIIYDMDCEIREFEDKLHKYKKIKQGMMNDLLTGKIRLV